MNSGNLFFQNQPAFHKTTETIRESDLFEPTHPIGGFYRSEAADHTLLQIVDTTDRSRKVAVGPDTCQSAFG